MKICSSSKRPLQIENLQSRSMLAADGVLYISAADVYAALLSQSQISQEIFFARGFQAVPSAGLGYQNNGGPGSASLQVGNNSNQYTVEDIGGLRFTFAPLQSSGSNIQKRIVAVSRLDDGSSSTSLEGSGFGLGNGGDGSLDANSGTSDSHTGLQDRPGDANQDTSSNADNTRPDAHQATGGESGHKSTRPDDRWIARLDRALANLFSEFAGSGSLVGLGVIDGLAERTTDLLSGDTLSLGDVNLQGDDDVDAFALGDERLDGEDSDCETSNTSRHFDAQALSFTQQQFSYGPLQRWIVQFDTASQAWSQLALEQMVALRVHAAPIPEGVAIANAWQMPLLIGGMGGTGESDWQAGVDESSGASADRWQFPVSVDAAAPAACAVGVTLVAAFARRKHGRDSNVMQSVQHAY